MQMDFSDLPESARMSVEVAQNEADAILAVARRGADEFAARAYEMGVDPSGVGYSPGDSALALSRRELIAGRDRAAGHLLGAIVREYIKTGLGIDEMYAKIVSGGDFVASRYQLDRSTLDQLTQYCRTTALRVKSNEATSQARTDGGPLASADWNKNPFPVGSVGHQILEDCSLLAKERLALFAAEQFGKIPAEKSPNEVFLKFQCESVAGVFDVWAGIFAENCPMTDAAATTFGELCGELEKMLNDQARGRAISGISRQTYQSAMNTRLLQRRHFWIGHMLGRVREHKQAARVKSESPRQAEHAEGGPNKDLGTPAKLSEETSGRDFRVIEDSSAVETPRPHLITRGSIDAAAVRGLVDGFLGACNLIPAIGRNVIEKDIWLAARHKQPRQFQYWKAGQKRALGGTRGYTNEDDKNFCRILNMAPAAFVALLREQGRLRSSA